MCLLDGVDSTLCCTKIRQRLLQIFIRFRPFYLNTGSLCLTVAGDDSDLLSSVLSFGILDFEFLNKLVYFLLGLLQFDLFFLQINFQFFNTLSCFLQLVKTKSDVLIFNIDSVILLLVYILVEINE